MLRGLRCHRDSAFLARMLVFIDESGDPGFKLQKGSSPLFVVSLVAFISPDEAQATENSITAMAQRLRIPGEFKFSKCRPEVRDAFFDCVQPHDYLVRAIVVDKSRIYSPHLRTNKEGFYSFFVKTMLKFDDGLLNGARIIIDGSGDRAFRGQLNTYLRRHLDDGAVARVRFSNSANDRLVQLADMCAGAVARSYKKDRTDAWRWRDKLGRKLENVWNFK